MLSGILQLLFNACDLVVVGKFAGDNSLAAVGSTGSITSLLVNLFIGFSVGANVAVARSIGRKNKERVHDVVHTAVLFSFLSGLFLTVFGFFTARYLLVKMNTNLEILDKATTYLKICLAGSVFNMVYNFGASIVRATGETKKPLYFLIFSGIINVLLNLFFVIVLKMDVAGVALATIISQMISAVLIISYLMKLDGVVRLNIKDLKIDKSSLNEMILIGLPAGIQNSIFSISNVSVQTAVNSFNSTAIVAGNSASNNIGSFIYTSMNSFYQACITFTSQNFGARNIKNCKKSLLYCLLCGTIVGLVIGGVAVLLGEPLLGLYANGEDAIKYGLIRLTIVGLSYFLCGIADVLVGGLRGLGYSIIPMITSIIGICGVRMAWIYTVFERHHTLQVLYVSYRLSWIITAIIHLICYIFIYKRICEKFRRENKMLVGNFY